MRLEYVVVSFVIIALVLIISIGLLSGVIPGFSAFFGKLGGLIGVK
jgi:hypothetical protein